MGKLLGKAICFFTKHKRGNLIHKKGAAMLQSEWDYSREITPRYDADVYQCPRCDTTWKQGKRPRRKMRLGGKR